MTEALLQCCGGKDRLLGYTGFFLYINAAWIIVLLPVDTGDVPPQSNMVVGEEQ